MIGMAMAEVNYVDFRDFVEREMKQREMNATQFAKFIGVAHTTINRLIDPRNPTTPSPELLYKLAEKTGVNYTILSALVLPGAEFTEIDPKTLVRAERIRQLTPEEQDTIDSFITGMLLNKRK